MYPTIHKMLEHGESFMVLSPLPPGALSEPVMEAAINIIKGTDNIKNLFDTPVYKSTPKFSNYEITERLLMA